MGNNETTPLRPDSLLGGFTKPSKSWITESSNAIVVSDLLRHCNYELSTIKNERDFVRIHIFNAHIIHNCMQLKLRDSLTKIKISAKLKFNDDVDNQHIKRKLWQWQNRE